MKFRGDIEGLRAIAIVVVVIFHAELGFLHGGYVGVDMFFALSGYLITGLLLHQHGEQGRIDLVRFYARRARRLLPASALMVLVVVAVSTQVLGPAEMLSLAETALAVALLSSNLAFAYRSADYLGADFDLDPLLHTWSLGVEEQFYFAWPLLLWWALRVGVHRWLVLGLIALTLPLSAWLTAVDQPLAFFLSPVRAWEFALGASGVIFAERLRFVRGPLWAGLGLCMVLASAVLMSAETPFPGWLALIPTLGTLLLLLAGSHGDSHVVERLLVNPVAAEIGRLSYSWYLWHWPFLVLTPVVLGRELVVLETLGALVASLVVAKASFHLFEQPLRYAKFLEGNGRSLAFGLVLMIAGVGVAGGLSYRADGLSKNLRLGALTKAARQRPMVGKLAACHLQTPATKIAIDRCTLGPDGAPRVLLFGDSHAQQWFPALRPAAERGDIRLTFLTKSACAPLPVALFDPKLRRRYHECPIFVENVLAALPTIDPELVIITARSRPEATAEHWEQGLTEVVKAFRAHGTEVVLLEDVPLQPSPPASTCASRALMAGDQPDECTFALRWENHYPASIRTVADAVDGVRVVDLTDLVCRANAQGRCVPFAGDVPIWRDEHHLAVMFTESVSDEVMKRVLP